LSDPHRGQEQHQHKQQQGQQPEVYLPTQTPGASTQPIAVPLTTVSLQFIKQADRRQPVNSYDLLVS
jgi:hypothetical protein